MRRRPIGLLSALLFAATPMATVAEPLLVTVEGPYVHRGSGFVFPAAFGDFRRTTITEYDEAASDVGVGYDLPVKDGAVVVTVFVYPAPLASATSDPVSRDLQEEGLCIEHFAGMRASVIEQHAGAILTDEGQVPAPSSRHSRPGLRAAFRFESDFRGKKQMVRSEARLFCHVDGRWLISYRVTAPAAHDLAPDLDRLMTGLRWPEPAQ